jgi:hypothetical protein
MTVDRDRLVGFVPSLLKAADSLADFWRAMDQTSAGGPAAGDVSPAGSPDGH